MTNPYYNAFHADCKSFAKTRCELKKIIANECRCHCRFLMPDRIKKLAFLCIQKHTLTTLEWNFAAKKDNILISPNL